MVGLLSSSSPTALAVLGLSLGGTVAASALTLSAAAAPAADAAGAAPRAAADGQAAPPAGLRELALSAIVWPASLAVPLLLSRPSIFAKVFPATLKDQPLQLAGRTLKAPLGLALGIGAVVVGQIVTISYHYARRSGWLGTPTPVQAKGARSYEFSEGLSSHLGSPVSRTSRSLPSEFQHHSPLISAESRPEYTWHFWTTG